MIRRGIFVFIVVAISLGFVNHQPLRDTPATFSFSFISEKELVVGEEITYVVKYLLLKFGEIKLKVTGKKLVNGKTVYNTIAYIDSYSGIPFVDLHQIYESKLNNAYFSDFFRGIVKGKEYASYTEYTFDYPKKKVKVKKGKVHPYQLWNDTVGVAETEFQDGLSIFYYARMNLGRKYSVKVPCIVNEKKVFTNINFYDNTYKINFDGTNYPVACLRLDGSTDFVSVFGLTGYFEGWFSKDAASIPIVAKLNVIIGQISVELVKWKRPGWNPPRYE
jgi:hypothetical protein